MKKKLREERKERIECMLGFREPTPKAELPAGLGDLDAARAKRDAYRPKEEWTKLLRDWDDSAS